MIPADLREAQADACLEVAAAKKDLLLVLAVRLSGGDHNAGADLYQQTVLDCHDAIQRRGFSGDRYDFYLRQALIQNGRKLANRPVRTVPLTPLVENAPELPASVQAEANVTHLAEQVTAELEQLPAAEAAVFRLHVAGSTYREIAQLTGQSKSAAQRLVARVKAGLREVFGQAYEALSE